MNYAHQEALVMTKKEQDIPPNQNVSTSFIFTKFPPLLITYEPISNEITYILSLQLYSILLFHPNMFLNLSFFTISIYGETS